MRFDTCGHNLNALSLWTSIVLSLWTRIDKWTRREPYTYGILRTQTNSCFIKSEAMWLGEIEPIFIYKAKNYSLSQQIQRRRHQRDRA